VENKRKMIAEYSATIKDKISPPFSKRTGIIPPIKY